MRKKNKNEKMTLIYLSLKLPNSPVWEQSDKYLILLHEERKEKKKVF